MKYWFDKSTAHNNIIILSAKALIVASADESMHAHVEEQLNANTHPKQIFGANGFRVIPFAAMTGFDSASNVDTGLDISYKTKDQVLTLKTSFDNAKNKLECMGFIKKLTLKNKEESQSKKAVTQTTKTTNQKQNTGELPVSDIFTVKSSEPKKPKSKLDLNFDALLNPLLSLILAIVGAYFLHPKIGMVALAVGGFFALASLYFLYLGFKKSPDDDGIYKGEDSDKAEQSALSKLSDKVFGVLKPIYLIGLAALAVSALYFLIPNELRGPDSLYQAIQTHKTKGSGGAQIQNFLDKGADINYMAEDGTTPLITALNLNEERLAIELINKGATLSTQYIGQTPLDLAIEASLDKAVSIMLNKEMVTNNPQNLLLRGISSGLSFKNIQLIADSGMDMNHQDEEGLTALGMALLFGSEPRVVKLLLDRGASTKIKVGEMSPIEFARLRGYTEISEMLKQHSS